MDCGLDDVKSTDVRKESVPVGFLPEFSAVSQRNGWFSHCAAAGLVITGENENNIKSIYKCMCKRMSLHYNCAKRPGLIQLTKLKPSKTCTLHTIKYMLTETKYKKRINDVISSFSFSLECYKLIVHRYDP